LGEPEIPDRRVGTLILLAAERQQHERALVEQAAQGGAGQCVKMQRLL
jgi:hypothetical protein